MDQYLKLVYRAKHGSVDAFADLYQEVYEDLYRFAVYTLKNSVDAQDVVSETVADAFATIRKLRKEEAFKGWIFKILSAKCKRKLKEYANRETELSGEQLERLAAPNATMDMAEHVQLRMLYWELSAEERMIVALHVFAGYTSREIAKQLHMNENTVRSKESRALKKMKEQLIGTAGKQSGGNCNG